MGLLVVIPLVVLAALVVTVATALGPRGAAPAVDVTTSADAFAAARRHAGVVAALSWTALVVGSVALLLGVPRHADQGIALGCVPAVAGVVALLVAAVGERTWPRPAEPVRRASLVRRTAGDVAPRGPAAFVLGWSAALLMVLLATGLTADPSGRTVTFEPDAVSSSTGGPYPGAPYGVPIAVATLVLLAATGATLHLVAARPAVAHVSTTDDHRLRRASAGRVLAAVQLVVATTLAGVLLQTGSTLFNASRTWWAVDDVWTVSVEPVPRVLGVAALVAGVVVLVVSLVVTGLTLARASRSGSPAVPAPVAA